MTKDPQFNRRGVSAKKVRELLHDQRWVKDEAYTTKLNANSVVYVHPDGQVLDVFVYGRGCLYPSQADFEKLLHEIGKLREIGPRHVLYGRFPQGEDFIELVPQLIDELAVTLKIPKEELNGSLESLQRVDKAIRWFGKNKAVEAPVFPMLVAYVGEVMRLATGGHWEMRLDENDNTTIAPWIVDPQGRVCNPWLGTFDELYEQMPFSIYADAGVRITNRRVPLSVHDRGNSANVAIVIKRKPDTPAE